MNLEQEIENFHSHLDKVFRDACRASSSPAEVKRIISIIIDQQNNAPAEEKLPLYFYQLIFATQALYDSYAVYELDWVGAIRRHQ